MWGYRTNIYSTISSAIEEKNQKDDLSYKMWIALILIEEHFLEFPLHWVHCGFYLFQGQFSLFKTIDPVNWFTVIIDL